MQSFTRQNALFAANFFKSVVYHPDESQLLTCGTDRKITYWDVLNMNAIRIIDGSEEADVNTLHINVRPARVSLCGAYVLEVYLADCARAHRIQHNGTEAYRGYQSTVDAGRCA